MFQHVLISPDSFPHILPSCSACLVAPETRAAASAPVFAVGRAWAACWVPPKRLTVWRRTTCLPLARQEGDHVDLKEDAVQLQDSAATPVKSLFHLVDLVI